MTGDFCKLVACAGVLALVTGCGDSGPKMAPVTGKVVYEDGTPVPKDFQIAFHPDSSKDTKGPMAIGTTDENGEFVLYTGQKAGAIVGHFKVTVDCPFRLEGSSESGEETTDSAKSGPPCRLEKSVRSINTTQLTYEVVDGKNENVELKVSTK